MAFKGAKGLASLGSKLRGMLQRAPSPRAWLKAPLGQGVAAALILTAGLAILAINTLRIGALLSWGPPGGGTASLGRF